MKIFKGLFKSSSDNNFITIVSGLPRSGTSMMMRMLEAGGIPALTDSIREADIDNPKGYYEFEKVKQIKEDQTWLNDCRGKVVKMVSMLLYDLPNDRKYKIVFMRRNMAEILASQKKMLDRLQREGGSKQDSEMALEFEKHLGQITSWLTKQQHINVLYIDYNDVIVNPFENIQKVNQFFNNRLDQQEMMQVVDKSLYRQRK